MKPSDYVITPTLLQSLARQTYSDPLLDIAQLINIQLATCALQYRLCSSRDIIIESPHCIAPELQKPLAELFIQAGWAGLEYRRVQESSKPGCFRYQFTLHAPPV